MEPSLRVIEAGIDETLSHMEILFEHWTRIRTHNVIEQMK